jgi:hypothetical protein
MSEYKIKDRNNPCCERMRNALNNGAINYFTTRGYYMIVVCHMPIFQDILSIIHCPWCGKELEQ